MGMRLWAPKTAQHDASRISGFHGKSAHPLPKFANVRRDKRDYLSIIREWRYGLWRRVELHATSFIQYCLQLSASGCTNPHERSPCTTDTPRALMLSRVSRGIVTDAPVTDYRGVVKAPRVVHFPPLAPHPQRQPWKLVRSNLHTSVQHITSEAHLFRR